MAVICKKSKEYQSDCDCKRTRLVAKCKIFRTVLLNTSEAIVLCIDSHVHIISNVIGINGKKSLLKKEYRSDYRYERKIWLPTVKYL